MDNTVLSDGRHVSRGVYSVNVWEGIYDRFSDVPIKSDDLTNKQWTDGLRKKVGQELKNGSSFLAYNASLLAPTVAVLKSELRASKLRVIDFGGGLGATYVQMVDSLVDAEYLEYHVIELENISDFGAQEFINDHKITFHSAPPELNDVDIIHVGSTLQYLDDWRGAIESLAAYTPKYWLYTDLTAGEISTYVSVQRYYDLRIPVWFFNIHEVISEMTQYRFSLLLNTRFNGAILGKTEGCPQENFPVNYRLGYSRNLLFVRDG
jgi:putative methyltransferase (TIGR04325 family)